jgi:hypothetical protein
LRRAPNVPVALRWLPKRADAASVAEKELGTTFENDGYAVSLTQRIMHEIVSHPCELLLGGSAFAQTAGSGGGAAAGGSSTSSSSAGGTVGTNVTGSTQTSQGATGTNPTDTSGMGTGADPGATRTGSNQSKADQNSSPEDGSALGSAHQGK